MTKKNKLSLFRYLIFFIFFCSLFFINSLDVRAVGSGDINRLNYDIVPVGTMQKMSERKIIDGSTVFKSDIGAFHYGQTEKMVKYVNQYKSMTHEGTISNQYDFLTYCTRVLKLELGGDIIAYPDCMVIEEFVRYPNNSIRPNSKRNVTAWLYLYCNSKKYDEWVENKQSLGDYIPVLYGADGEASYITMFPAQYFYYPVSSIVSKGKVLSQIYTSGDTESAIRRAFESGSHDIGDFRGVSGYYDLDIGISKDDAWVMSFLNGCSIENGYNNEGISFDNQLSGYKLSWNKVKTTINKYPILSSFLDSSYVPSTGQCRGFKVDANRIGLDILFSGYTNLEVHNINKYRPDGWGNIVDVEKTAANILEVLGDRDLDMTTIGLYSQAKVETECSAAYIHIPSVGDGGLRYVWGTNSCYIAKSNDLEMLKDVNPDKGFSYSTYRVDISGSYKSNRTLKNYPDYGNILWSELSDENKIISTITILQDNPSLFGFVYGKVTNKTGTVADIVSLNQLGATDYAKWAELVLKMGDIIYKGCSVSNAPSNGWSVVIGIDRAGNNSNYAISMVGISLVKSVSTPANDLVLSNSYNTSPSTYEKDVNFNSTARNVIDWMHNGSTSDVILRTNSGLPAFSASALGGRSSINSEITGTDRAGATTYLDLSSQWSRYDIGCGIVLDNNITSSSTNLSKDSNNTIKVDVNPTMAAAYENSKERVYYNTFVFVGRTPESDPTVSVNTSDFKVIATAKFNNYNAQNFDASYNPNQATQYMIMNACKDGTAAETMNVYFSSFQTDYNVNILFKNYKSNSSYYSTSSGLKVNVIAQPYAIQKMDKNTLALYEKENYAEFGPNTTGYSGLRPVASSTPFTNTNGNVEMEPGDVLAFQLAYTIPNDTTLSQDIKKNSATSEYSKSLYNSGEWYQKYGSINMVDLDFQLVPAKGKEDKWNKINANSNNDWVRERLNPPLMNNIFFTHADVKIDGVTVQSYDASITTIADNITASTGRDSTRATIFNLSESDLFGGNSGGTTQYNKSNVQLNVSWRYWCRGKYATSTDRNTYNYLDYSNGFTGESSSTANINDGTKITALTVNPGLTQSDMISNPNENKLSLKLNQNVLNSAKDKSISVSVPNNQSNQFHEDWEIVSLNIKSPDKDNAAIDLVLTSGGAVLGDMNAKRGGTTVSQQLNQNYSNCVIYAVVRRDAPSDTSWKELIKNTDSNSVREQYIPSTGALKLTLTVNGGTPYSVTPSLVTGGVPGGYTGKSVTDFRNSGDYLVYKYNIPGEIKSLKADMDFRNDNSIYFDFEDSAISNNSWSEQWESVMNPDYELSIIDGQPNVIKQSNNSCPPAENIKPYLNFTVAQLNENFNGNKAVLVHVYIAETGEVPEQIHGLQYMGGGKAFRAFGSGVTEPIECRAEFKERFVPYTQGSGANKTYTINAHINYADCKNDPTEVNYDNNYKEHLYTVNLSCGITTGTPTPIPPCVTGQLEHRTARTIYGLGQKYEWDVKFGWSQSSSNQTDSVNVYVAHYTDGCPSRYETETDDEGNSHSVLVEYIEHEHCPCYCSPQGYAANNGKKYWRNRDLGLGLYYEYHDLRIYVWSSAHGLRDVSSGSTVVYTGETFYFYFDAIYVSNRTDQPNAKHEPYSQPYATGNGGSGCRQPCNTLSRYPDVRNVAGPQKVKIQISGTQGYNMNRVYYSPQQILSNGAVNKHYRWKPIPDKIYVAKTNVNQKINLSIGSYDFLGHWEDTSDNPDGAGYNYPGYAWYSRESHVFCGVRNATIYIRPSKPYLGTNPGSNGNGVDGSNPGNGGTPWADGDTWVQ